MSLDKWLVPKHISSSFVFAGLGVSELSVVYFNLRVLEIKKL